MVVQMVPPTEDGLLVRRIRRGEAQLFRQIVDRHLPAVYGLIYRLTQNNDLSEELTQETFVKAYQNLHQFDASRPLKPWLLRIANNTTISHLRKSNRVVSLTEMEESGRWEEAQFGQANLDGAPDVRLEQQANGEAVNQLLATMDIKYRQVLSLRYHEDLSYDQIAETTGLPLNTVRTRLKRGLEKLRELLLKEVQP